MHLQVPEPARKVLLQHYDSLQEMTLLSVVGLKKLLPFSGKKGTAGSSKTTVPVYQATWCHIPENTNPDARCRACLVPHKTFSNAPLRCCLFRHANLEAKFTN